MFTEPQTVTINAIAKPLPRVAFGDRKGVFDDGANRLTLSHTFGRRNRHNARLDIVKTAADPLLDGVSREYSMSVQVIVDYPPVGFSTVERQNNAKALADYLANTTNLSKLVGGES